MILKKLIIYIAMSVDGYIADCNDDLSFLSIVEKESEDYGYSTFINTIDTVIIGRKTFDKIVSMGYQNPHPDKNVYIISRTEKPRFDNYHYYTGSLSKLINTLKQEPGKNIYCDGGAEIVNELLTQNLVDEIILSVIPILLGSGISLFKNGLLNVQLELLSSKNFEKGLVQLHYKCLNT